MVVGFVSSVAEDLDKCPLVRVHGGFREEKDVRGVKIYHGDQIRQRGDVIAHFLGADSENGYHCRGRGCRWRGCVHVEPRWRGVRGMGAPGWWGPIIVRRPRPFEDVVTGIGGLIYGAGWQRDN